MSNFLEGTNVKPHSAADAKSLLKKNVQYLRTSDIDRSGRGYIFPKSGVVTGCYGKNLEINGDSIPFSALVEVVVLGDATDEELEIYR